MGMTHQKLVEILSYAMVSTVSDSSSSRSRSSDHPSVVTAKRHCVCADHLDIHCCDSSVTSMSVDCAVLLSGLQGFHQSALQLLSWQQHRGSSAGLASGKSCKLSGLKEDCCRCCCAVVAIQHPCNIGLLSSLCQTSNCHTAGVIN